MPESFESEVNPEKIKKAEMVVCIPSYKEADSISYPVIQADKGLDKYFQDNNSVIINCDNNSPDDTKQVFLDTPFYRSRCKRKRKQFQEPLPKGG